MILEQSDLETPGTDDEANLHVVVTSRGETLQLRVLGELDLCTAPNLVNVLVSVIDGAYRRVALDLDGVSFMDTSGLDSLLRCRQETERRGFHLEVLRISAQARRVVDVTDSASALGVS